VSVQAIQFTQEQARALTGVTPAAVRHWRRVIPYLALKSGKSARFTFADLVGLAITGQLVASFGVRIAEFADGIDSLFRALSAAKPSRLEEHIAVIAHNDGRLYLLEDLTQDSGEFWRREVPDNALVVRCAPHIARMRSQMVPFVSGMEQPNLPFSPQAIGTK